MQKMKFRGFQLFHNNREATESMIRQIDEFPSFFTPTEDQPLIIDCGANIGVSASGRRVGRMLRLFVSSLTRSRSRF